MVVKAATPFSPKLMPMTLSLEPILSRMAWKMLSVRQAAAFCHVKSLTFCSTAGVTVPGPPEVMLTARRRGFVGHNVRQLRSRW